MLLFGLIFLVSSCATTMAPIELNASLRRLTQSTFISPAQAEELTTSGKCKYITKNREYAAPMGLTAKDDLRNGARGIDDWVKLDGGTAYVLRSYQWIAVGDQGGTQLHVEFDTMLCQ